MKQLRVKHMQHIQKKWSAELGGAGTATCARALSHTFRIRGAFAGPDNTGRQNYQLYNAAAVARSSPE